jgi:hypothetical protein
MAAERTLGGSRFVGPRKTGTMYGNVPTFAWHKPISAHFFAEKTAIIAAILVI